MSDDGSITHIPFEDGLVSPLELLQSEPYMFMLLTLFYEIGNMTIFVTQSWYKHQLKNVEIIFSHLI